MTLFQSLLKNAPRRSSYKPGPMIRFRLMVWISFQNRSKRSSLDPDFFRDNLSNQPILLKPEKINFSSLQDKMSEQSRPDLISRLRDFGLSVERYIDDSIKNLESRIRSSRSDEYSNVDTECCGCGGIVSCSTCGQRHSVVCCTNCDCTQCTCRASRPTPTPTDSAPPAEPEPEPSAESRPTMFYQE